MTVTNFLQKCGSQPGHSSKFKAELITTKETIPTITENYKKNVMSLFGFV
jgi:hypothetical protein